MTLVSGGQGGRLDKNKIVATAIILFLLVFFAVGSVYAWYSDVKEMEGNESTAGVFEMDSDDTIRQCEGLFLVYPGWSFQGGFAIRNAGSIDGTICLSFVDIKDMPGEGVDTTSGTTSADSRDLSDYVRFRLSYEIWDDGVKVVAQKYVRDQHGDPVVFRISDFKAGKDGIIPLQELADLGIGEKMELFFDAFICEEIGNEIQGSQMSFVIRVTMTQKLSGDEAACR